jgi:hypothetical protein
VKAVIAIYLTLLLSCSHDKEHDVASEIRTIFLRNTKPYTQFGEYKFVAISTCELSCTRLQYDGQLKNWVWSTMVSDTSVAIRLTPQYFNCWLLCDGHNKRDRATCH